MAVRDRPALDQDGQRLGDQPFEAIGKEELGAHTQAVRLRRAVLDDTAKAPRDLASNRAGLAAALVVVGDLDGAIELLPTHDAPACRLGYDPLVGHNGLVDETTAATVEAIANRVRPVLEADPRVRFAYLFGSQARRDARPNSDVDLAVSLRPQGSLLDDARLHDQLAAALGRDDVDLLVLEDAPLWLQFRVVGGRVLFSRDEQERIAFREYVEKMFLDFRPYYDSYLAAARERARRGVLSGG